MLLENQPPYSVKFQKNRFHTFFYRCSVWIWKNGTIRFTPLDRFFCTYLSTELGWTGQEGTVDFLFRLPIFGTLRGVQYQDTYSKKASSGIHTAWLPTISHVRLGVWGGGGGTHPLDTHPTWTYFPGRDLVSEIPTNVRTWDQRSLCEQNACETRMHSSRMRTACWLTRGGAYFWGVHTSGGCIIPVRVEGCIVSGCILPWTEWNTPVKTLPCPILRIRAVNMTSLHNQPWNLE